MEIVCQVCTTESSKASTLIELEGVGLDMIHLVSIVYFTLLRILGRYKCHQQGFLPPTTGCAISLCTESVKRCSIEHSSVVGLSK